MANVEYNFLPILNIISLPCIVIILNYILRNAIIRHTTSLLIIVCFIHNIMCTIYNLDNIGQVKWVWLELLPGLKIEFYLEITSLMFVAMTAVLWFITYIYSLGYFVNKHQELHTRNFYLYMSIGITCTTLLGFSANLFTLFIFYEFLTLSTYPLVSLSKSVSSYNAGRKYLMYLLFTSTGLLLPAIIITYMLAGSVEFTLGGIIGFNANPLIILILLAMYIFGVAKAALIPMHSWLPTAMVAPIPVSALLHAVAVVKAGIFTLIKILFYIFDVKHLHYLVAHAWLGYNIVQIITIVTIIIASLYAIKQNQIKSILAYSTIAQLAYCVMTLSLFSKKAIAVTIFQMFAHAAAKISLFFAAGNIQKATGITEINKCLGLARELPFTIILFMVCALSIIGMPFTAGFMSKYYLIIEALRDNNVIWPVLITIILGTIFSTCYFIPIIFKSFWSVKDINIVVKDIPISMRLTTVTTTLIVFLLFIYAGNIISYVENLL
ncbi:Na(+)/H(+) antiporter subunit A [Rickettsiales bacterium Ac37b]|nr:Na(+)/H(+) antiporter subunit A [Rickettsiales bacterium Ac37b]